MEATVRLPDGSRFDGESLTKGLIRIDLEDIGEGVCEDYREDDPTDVPLLRFTVWMREKGSKEWYMVDDAPYCTADVPTFITPKQRLWFLQVLMSRYEEPLLDGASVKKLGEELSWIGLDNLPDELKNDHLETPEYKEYLATVERAKAAQAAASADSTLA